MSSQRIASSGIPQAPFFLDMSSNRHSGYDHQIRWESYPSTREHIGPPFPHIKRFWRESPYMLLSYPESPHRLLREPILSLTLVLAGDRLVL